MIQVKKFSGVLNTDDAPAEIDFLHHMDARNIVFRGSGANMRWQNIPGNIVIPNESLPAGTNVCIGAWYDQVKGRIFSFIYNSNNDHGIYIYTPSTAFLQPLIISNTGTDGDVLRFDIQVPILNVNIIYGDSTQGDILYWINSQKKPCKINIDRALSGGYGTIEESFLDVAKEPPSIPPYVVYEDDASISVNNLRKRLFKFKTRYVFDDDEKSVTSQQSEIPVPYNPFDTDVDTDPTKNVRIAVIYQTGAANVKKIELLAAVSIGNEFSDFFLVASIDKDDSGLNDNDVTVFNFYNDQAYNYIDLEESIQLFDYVPLQAYAQETLNGNVLIYGNITEGYPNITDFSTSNVAFQAEPYYSGRYFSLLVGNQSGDSGFGTGNVHVMVKGRVTSGNIYILSFTDATSISYVAGVGDDVLDVLQGLIDDAILQGYTVTGSTATPDAIYFSQVGKSLALVRLVVNAVSENTDNGNNGSLMAYDWWSRYAFGLVYFDQKGRTNGVVYPVNVFSGQTIGYEEISTVSNIPEMMAEIYHTPPEWAYYYSWVRTKNTTKSSFVQWVSDRTLKDDVALDVNENAYAYISIQPLVAFKERNPTSPLSYSFTPNDRIRFIKLFNDDGSVNEIYTDKDFEIQGLLTNPVINGREQEGQFVKIILPTTDATFDFGTEEFAFYFFELYTPAQSVAGGLDVYYEFGERYAIGDPTLPTRFHQGETQNQIGTSAATFFFTKGDDWLRLRRYQIGVQLDYSIPATNCLDSDAGQITLGVTFENASLDDPNILTGNSPCNNLLDFNVATNDDRWLIKIVSGSYAFRIVGDVTIVFSDTLPGDTYEFFLERNDGTRFYLVEEFDSSEAGRYSFHFDTTFTLDAGERIFIFGFSPGANDHTRTFEASSLTITRQLAFTQTAIDPNFSDYYPSAVNSNGRAFIYDENADTVRYPVLMRWGLSYEANTNINRTNRFYPQNLDETDRAKGDIQRFKSRDRIMRIFQKRGCGQVGVYAKFIKDNSGSNALVTTDEIITRNNIQYYTGEYGVGNHPESLVSGTIQDYFVDPIRGYQVRLSNDGMTPISEIYKGQFYIRSLLVPYNKTFIRPDNSLSKILGVYDYLNEEYICILQSGEETGEGEQVIDNYTFSFNEMRNAYSSFFDYHPEWMVCAEDVLYSWSNGNLYVHNSPTYCNFFGQQYSAYITVPFNQNLLEKKTWISLSEIANTIWECPEIYTNVMSYGTQRQESSLVPSEFRILESMPSASFKRDIHSQGGKINGSTLKGNWLVVKFQKTNATELVYLSAVSVKYIDSPLTPK